ncbi:MAG: lysophospholipase, partial [Chloroherpetonaceae bacterium]|nr:lysophospholipase [Chloroherpetonaceae bacterium]
MTNWLQRLSLFFLIGAFGCGVSQTPTASVFDITADDRAVYERLIREPDTTVCYFTSFDLTPIAYRLILPAKEPNMVVAFIHGIAAQSKLYLPLADSLARRGIATALLDLRGHGCSGGPRGDVPSLDALVRDVRLFLDTLRYRFPGKKLILGGHSLGAGLSLRFLLEFSDRKHLYRAPDGLILMAGGFFSNPRCDSLELQARRQFLRRGAFASLDGWKMAAVFPASLLNLKPYPIKLILPNDALVEKAVRDTLLTTEYTMQFLFAAFPTDLAAAYRQIKFPTLLVVGQRDELVRICDADTSLKRLINAEARELFVVQDANHINIIWKSAGAISDWLL